ncbi:hypothetical protein [Ensifer aridi]|uniref:hypothetical protein n=1 Tax=Ensifer aridi TaxID=1708715 RepID=UPI00111C85E0|nr:hypothetical protein [Ensifer aridi]
MFTIAYSEGGDQLAQALAVAKTYRQSLDALDGQADELTPLRRLRAAAPILATLVETEVQNAVLAHYRRRANDGAELDDNAAANEEERFLYLMNDVAASAASLERCVAAIDTQEAKDQGFTGLPLGHVLLASRFLPAPLVEGALKAADLINRRATLTEKDADELRSALTAAAGFHNIEQSSSMSCERVVTTYTFIKLRQSGDSGPIIQLDEKTAHTHIGVLP